MKSTNAIFIQQNGKNPRTPTTDLRMKFILSDFARRQVRKPNQKKRIGDKAEGDCSLRAQVVQIFCRCYWKYTNFPADENSFG